MFRSARPVDRTQMPGRLVTTPLTRRSVVGFALVGLGGAMAGCAAAPQPPVSSPPTSSPAAALFGRLPSAELRQTSALQRILENAVDDGAPAVLASVVTSAGLWSGAAGTDGPKGRAARAGDVAPIASVSKTFTAALAHRLEETGRWSLDDPLAKWLDAAAAAKANGATVREAIGMRAGIPDTQDDVRERFFAHPAVAPSRAAIVASLPDADRRPGGDAANSNPTYKLLGWAAERAGGSDLAALIDRLVVAPAGVPGTLLVQHAGARTPGPWALPAEAGAWGAGGTLPFLADSVFSGAASAMAADTRSLAVWAWQLFAGSVVSPASLAQLMRPGAGDIGNGLDPADSVGSAAAFGHSGSKDGYAVQLTVVPTLRRVAAVVVPQSDADAAAVTAALLAEV